MLGFIGRNGAYPANQAGRHSDLVITIGTQFDDTAKPPSTGTWQSPPTPYKEPLFEKPWVA